MIVNPANHWKLGLFVVGSAAMGFGALTYFGAERISRETFEVVSYFGESVEGLDVGSPVKYRGVTLGRVEKIGFAPNRTDVAVTSEIFFETVKSLGLLEQLPTVSTGLNFEIEGLRVQLSRSGITGIAYLEADVFDTERMPEPVYDFTVPWNHVPSTESTLASLGSTLAETLDSMPELLKSTNDLVNRLDGALESLDVESIGADTRATLGAVRDLAQDLSALETAQLVGDLRLAVEDVRALTAQVSTALEPLGPAVVDAREAASAARVDLAETGSAIRAASVSVESLTDESRLLARDLRVELSELGETLGALRRLAELLERDPSSLLRGRQP
ncbi:MlaD family protein [Engelhardtia mirabilis]|uniref:Paraquat-inducible protein B n=1 Tax=Engelhardtia mirabilis TaxID=2528011 RepID=A0A518BLH3_9BACT|nr:paraquat-inducible protein B [Planctomycetes bacterium Pla133]QDV02140.1 paraquat-inducible protein B [Planctomycetes bacterium Pla86]